MAFFYLLTWMLGLYRCGYRETYALPFNAFACITLTLLLFGLFGALPLGLSMVKIVGVVFILSLAVDRRTHKAEYWRDLNFSALLVFFIGYLILALKLHGTTFSETDEFSHWGLIGKEFLLEQSLPTNQFTTLFKTYPPASGMMQYFFYSLLGDNPQYANLAIATFILSTVFLLFKQYTWHTNKKEIFLSIIFIYFSLFVLGQGIKSVLIDQLISITAGCALVYCLINPNKARYLTLSLACSLLVMEKSVGLLIALIISLFCIIDALYAKKNELSYAFIPLISLLFWAVSWRYYINTHDLNGVFSHYSTINNIKQLVTGTLNPRQMTIIHDFFSALIFERASRSPRVVSAFAWLIILSVFSILAYRYPNKLSKTRLKVLFAFLYGGFLVYFIGLLSLYLFTFDNYEGSALASYTRYASTYIFMWAITIFTLCASSTNASFKKYSMVTWVVLMLALTPWKPFDFLYKKPVNKEYVQNLMLAYEIDHINDIHNAAIYIIFQGSNGEENSFLRYYTYPNRTNHHCASIGKPLQADDYWSCNLTLENLTKILSDYDYVWVVHGDNRLEKNYGVIFPKNPHGLYRIIHLKNQWKVEGVKS